MRKTCLVLVALAAMSGIAVAGNFNDPAVITDTRIAPDYPPAARAAGFEGDVTVAAVVNTDGSVGAVEVIDSSSPNLGFEEAAMAAIRQWNFEPARLDGEAVDAVFAYVFYFEGGRERSNIPAYVAGHYLTSVAVGGVMGKNLPVTSKTEGFSPAAYAKDRLQRMNLPPGGPGTMYDRTTLIPPPSVGTNHPNRSVRPNQKQR